MTNEQWDAIVESRARALDGVFCLAYDQCPDDSKANRRAMAELALSGVRELIEAGEGAVHYFLTSATSAAIRGDEDAAWGYRERSYPLRNAIKGVRDE